MIQVGSVAASLRRSQFVPTPPSTSALQEILDRFLAGDTAAKNSLVDRANGRLLVVARGLLNGFPVVRQHEETAGVLNEAYQRISSALDDVRPATVRQFFGLVALQLRRVLLDLVRKYGPTDRDGNPRPITILTGGDEDGGLDSPDTGLGADASGAKADVRTAVGTLPRDEREVIDLIFFNGLTQAEAADLLGVHEDTVKRRWLRAKVKLGEALAAYSAGE